MADIDDSRGDDDVFAARPGADIILGDSVEDAPRRDAVDGEFVPGRGRGYVVEGEAGLDWLFSGAPGDDVHSLPGDVIRPVFNAVPASDAIDPVFIRSRRQRRRHGRRA